MKDLIQEGRKIQETFNKRMMNEFSIKGEVHTRIEVWMDATQRYYQAKGFSYPFGYDLDSLISLSNKRAVNNKLIDTIKQFAQKNNGEAFHRIFNGVLIHYINWEYEMSGSEFMNVYEKLVNELSGVFNTQLFSYYTGGFTYTATGMMGTSIGKNKVKLDFLPHSSSVGVGDDTSDEFNNFVSKLLERHPDPAGPYSPIRKQLIQKIYEIMKSYLNDPRVLFKETDWVSELKVKVQKLFVNPRIRARSTPGSV